MAIAECNVPIKTLLSSSFRKHVFPYDYFLHICSLLQFNSVICFVNVIKHLWAWPWTNLNLSVILALPTSKMSACRCRILLLGALSVRRSVHGDLFVEQEQWSSVDGVFSVAAPVVWNSLPAHLRSPLISRGQFRAGLKTHLFKQASENILF